MNNDDYVNNFMKRLREQAASTERQQTPEQLDRKIMNTIAKWWRNDSVGYLGFIKKGKTEVEFFAHNHARAGVGKEEGWESMKKAMDGIRVLNDSHRAKYNLEYDGTPFDPDFREGFEKH